MTEIQVQVQGEIQKLQAIIAAQQDDIQEQEKVLKQKKKEMDSEIDNGQKQKMSKDIQKMFKEYNQLKAKHVADIANHQQKQSEYDEIEGTDFENFNDAFEEMNLKSKFAKPVSEFEIENENSKQIHDANESSQNIPDPNNWVDFQTECKNLLAAQQKAWKEIAMQMFLSDKEMVNAIPERGVRAEEFVKKIMTLDELSLKKMLYVMVNCEYKWNCLASFLVTFQPQSKEDKQITYILKAGLLQPKEQWNIYKFESDFEKKTIKNIYYDWKEEINNVKNVNDCKVNPNEMLTWLKCDQALSLFVSYMSDSYGSWDMRWNMLASNKVLSKQACHLYLSECRHSGRGIHNFFVKVLSRNGIETTKYDVRNVKEMMKQNELERQKKNGL